MGVIGSIIGNLLTKKIDRLLEKTNAKRFESQRLKELERYKRLYKRIQSKTLELSFIFQSMLIVSLYVSGFELMNVTLFVVHSMSEHTDFLGTMAYLGTPFALCGLLIGTISLSLATRRLLLLGGDITRLGNFPKYLAGLEKRFGKITFEEP